MKKQIVYLIIALIVVAIGTTLFVILQQRRAHWDLHRLPESKPHQHVSTDGDVVEHIHSYETSEPVETESTEANRDETAKTNTNTLKPKKRSRIQIAWEKLDLESIKRDWQPYTIAEMHKMWWYQEFILPNGINYEKKIAKIDELYPRDEWLQRYMNLGHPFLKSSYYRKALMDRKQLERDREKFNRTDPRPQPSSYSTWRAEVLDKLDLPPEATWKEYEEVFMKWNVVTVNAFERAEQTDSNYRGGIATIDGVLIPFKRDTVHVHLNEETGYSRVVGAKLTREEKDTLTMYGVAPEGMHVVYIDKAGHPLPVDTPIPRFYERRMRALEQAEKQVEKMIADHEALFKSMPSVQPQQTEPASRTLQPDEHMHPHPHPPDVPNTQENAQRPDHSKPKREIPPHMLPPEPPGPYNIQQWFEVLQELHGGDLPKDLRALQKVVKELEAIRKAGEEKLFPKRTDAGHRPSERSEPKAPNRPDPPAAQE